MSKVPVRENYRVVIDVDAVAAISDARQAEREAEKIKQQVIRHVDVHHRSVRVDCDFYYVCQHCRWRWEPDFDGPEGPACCEKAVEEWRLAKIDGGANG